MYESPLIPGGYNDTLHDTAQYILNEGLNFNEDVLYFVLVPHVRMKPHIEVQIRKGGPRLPHFVNVFDSPGQLAPAVHRASADEPSKVVVIRILSLGATPTAWQEPLVLNANIRVAIIGDFTDDQSCPRGYLRDTSKFGKDLLESCKHKNLLLANVGFYAGSKDLMNRFGSAAACGSTSIVVGAGSTIAPWFSSSVIGSWGVTALTGATGFALIGSAAAGFYLWRALSRYTAPSGKAAIALQEQLDWADILAYHNVRLGDLWQNYGEMRQMLDELYQSYGTTREELLNGLNPPAPEYSIPADNPTPAQDSPAQDINEEAIVDNQKKKKKLRFPNLKST